MLRPEVHQRLLLENCQDWFIRSPGHLQQICQCCPQRPQISSVFLCTPAPGAAAHPIAWVPGSLGPFVSGPSGCWNMLCLCQGGLQAPRHSCPTLYPWASDWLVQISTLALLPPHQYHLVNRSRGLPDFVWFLTLKQCYNTQLCTDGPQLMMVQKWHTFSRNCTSSFDLFPD